MRTKPYLLDCRNWVIFILILLKSGKTKFKKSGPNSPDCNKIENKFTILLQQVPASSQIYKRILKNKINCMSGLLPNLVKSFVDLSLFWLHHKLGKKDPPSHIDGKMQMYGEKSMQNFHYSW